MREPYISYKATVEGLIRKINKKYSMERWNPIVYRDTKAEHEDLVAYYRMADVAVVSSIYDGMNLVAKEFIASQTDKKGVLLLSEFAGAAEELEGAILVNPYDIEEFSECIKRVLELPVEEKMCRIKTLQRQVRERDIYRWISDILKEVVILYSKRTQECCYLFDYIKEIPRDNIFLFLDYDGTLTPIVDSPDRAILSNDVKSLLIKLKETFPIAIVSGRALDDIMRLVTIEDLIYAGNHGAEMWVENKVFIGQQISDTKELLKKVVKELEETLSTIPGVIVEDKGITASIHYRMVNPNDICRLFDIFWKITDKYRGLFKITAGKKVFEMRPHGIWNKGDAVEWIMKNFGKGKTPIYIGDDITDEDAFRAVKGKGIAISVGKNEEADYYLKGQEEVKKFLLWIGNLQE
jgi:trehalose 6-phosphate synthase/phosphatase